MKKSLWAVSLALAICVLIFSCGSSYVQDMALESSVQITTYLPVLKVSFTNPLPEDEPWDKVVAGKILDARIENLEESIRAEIKSEIEKGKENRYESSLTDIKTWIEKSRSKTAIPIGSLPDVPKWANYPQKVLVAYKTEEKDIKPWQKDAEEDVYAISTVTGVSIPKAKEMLSKIQSEGYTISKEEVRPDAEVALLWFDDGWSDTYPRTLDWSVIVEGTEANLLTGYENGVLITKPLPDDKKIFVTAGYFDLQDKFKEKSDEIKSLERQVERLEKLKESLEEDKENLQEEATKKDKKKWPRDITKATFADVMYGTVKIEMFWTSSVGTGVYIGDQTLHSETWGYSSYWGGSNFRTRNTDFGLVLTNAHVAADSIRREYFVTEDREAFFLIGPGTPYIRYTDESDSVGSPAFVLSNEMNAVMSRDYDCAIMVTQKVPGYDKHAAKLGDSDNAKAGDKITYAGNPFGMQKFLSNGEITKSRYSLADSLWGEMFLKWGGKIMTIKNLWHNAFPGQGGTSGSALFAMNGPETGKVIGLHHAGLSSAVRVSEAKTETVIPDLSIAVEDILINTGWGGYIKNITKEQTDKLFADYSFRDAKFQTKPLIGLKETDEPFATMLTDKYRYVMVPLPGMNAAIPINPIKQYLQERGFFPDDFNFKGLSKEDWGS